jgi:hypothetical protein
MDDNIISKYKIENVITFDKIKNHIEFNNLTEEEQFFLKLYCDYKNKILSLTKYANDKYNVNIKKIFNKFRSMEIVNLTIVCECCGKTLKKGYYYLHKRTDKYKRNIEKKQNK